MPYFQIFVQTIEGKSLLFGEKTNLYQTSKVSELFTQVSEKTSIPENELRLVFAGKQLDTQLNLTLGDYGIQANSTIWLVVRLRGGLNLK